MAPMFQIVVHWAAIRCMNSWGKEKNMYVHVGVHLEKKPIEFCF